MSRNNKRRIEKYIWSDMVMSQMNNTQWLYKPCLITGPSSGAAALPQRWKAELSGTPMVQPEVWELEFSGSFAAADTITIGSNTYTANAAPAAASDQFSAGGTAEVVAEDLLACTGNAIASTGLTVTRSGAKIIFTQTVSGTGAAPTVSLGVSNTGTGAFTLSNVQNYHADTILIGATTFTCTDATTLAGNNFNPGTPDSIVARIETVAPSVSGYTLSCEGNAILFTESTAGTGTAPTVSAGASNRGTVAITISTDRDYRPAGTAADARYDLIPGDLLVLDTSKGTNGYDADGSMHVTPFNVSTFVAGTTVIAGFAVDYLTVENGETDRIAVCTNGVQLVQNRLPSEDVFGNTISYAYSANSLRSELESKNFQFGNRVEAGLY